ncbi:hypothetical protein NIES2130_33120, partial [Scytonema sp. HK-05]
EPEALISRYQVEPGNEGLDGDAMSLFQLLQDISKRRCTQINYLCASTCICGFTKMTFARG